MTSIGNDIAPNILQAQVRAQRQECAMLQEAVDRLESENMQLHQPAPTSGSPQQQQQLQTPSEAQLNRRIAELTENLSRCVAAVVPRRAGTLRIGIYSCKMRKSALQLFAGAIGHCCSC